MKKSLICFFIVFIMLCSCSLPVFGENIQIEKPQIKVYLKNYVDSIGMSNSLFSIVDSKELKFDVSPTIYDGRTYVPIRRIAEELGYDVSWDGDAECVTLSKKINVSNYNKVSQDTALIILLKDLEPKNTVDSERYRCPSYPNFKGWENKVRNNKSFSEILSIYDTLKVELKLYVDSNTSELYVYPIKSTSENYNFGCITAIHKSPDASTRIVKNRTLIPLRTVAELMGLFISWNGETNTIVISG